MAAHHVLASVVPLISGSDESRSAKPPWPDPAAPSQRRIGDDVAPLVPNGGAEEEFNPAGPAALSHAGQPYDAIHDALDDLVRHAGQPVARVTAQPLGPRSAASATRGTDVTRSRSFRPPAQQGARS